jgi:hypothetical protein
MTVVCKPYYVIVKSIGNNVNILDETLPMSAKVSAILQHNICISSDDLYDSCDEETLHSYASCRD